MDISILLGMSSPTKNKSTQHAINGNTSGGNRLVVSSRRPIRRSPETQEIRRKIIECLAHHDAVSVAFISEKTGIRESMLKHHLGEMRRDGVCYRIEKRVAECERDGVVSTSIRRLWYLSKSGYPGANED